MAVTAGTVWEIRSTAGTDRGGGFDPTVSVPGTDYSQQDAIQITYTDLVIDGTDNTKATSAGNPITSAHVGNVYNVTGGTGFTVQRVVLISQAAGVGTFNAALGTTGSTGGQAKMGGALSTLTGPALVAGNKVWVKATATYTIGSTQAMLNTSGTIGAPIVTEGYNLVRGDSGQVTIQATAGSSFSMVTGNGANRFFRNFIIDGNSRTSITGLALTGLNILVENIKAMNCTVAGFTVSTSSRARYRNCWALACSGTAGWNITTGTGNVFEGCVASDCTVTGFLINQNSATSLPVFIGCIADSNSGGSSNGFKVINACTAYFYHCVAYNNGSDGLLLDTTAVATAADGGGIRGCIFEANGGYGINANAANIPSYDNDYNFFYNNTSGTRNNLPTGSHSVNLSGSAFFDAASGDFSLNNTTGAGAAVRAGAWPGTLLYGGTGYRDGGALQHKDSGMVMSRVFTGF